jgi:hypothetical protein
MEKKQKEVIEICRNDFIYQHIHKILKSVKSKNLKINIINYLLINRKKAYFEYQKQKAVLKEDNKKIYRDTVTLLDLMFSLEDIFFIDVNKNNRYVEPSPVKDENLQPLVDNDKSIKDFYTRLDKQNKKNSVDYSNIRILNFFESLNTYKNLKKYNIDNFNITILDILQNPKTTILLELDLNKRIDELIEILKLAKKFYNKKKKILEEKEIIYVDDNTENSIYNFLFEKRSKKISLNESLVDILFIIDCKILNYSKTQIRNAINDFYTHCSWKSTNTNYTKYQYVNTLFANIEPFLKKITAF